MTFIDDIGIFVTRLTSLNTRVKNLDDRASDIDAKIEDIDERIKEPVATFASMRDEIKLMVRQQIAESARAIHEEEIKCMAADRFNIVIRDFKDEQVSKSGMEDWLSQNLEDRVGDCLDNLMCERTQRTIEEYSLATMDNVQEWVDEAMSNSNFLTEDCLADKAYELKNDILEEMVSEERVNDIFGECMQAYWEDSDIYDDIAAHTKSHIIISQVVTDVQCLNRVKRALEISGALKDASGEKDD